ncbi:hypothetical protein PUN28_015827 [Cardiocondyla obscurior]|uniref:Uncharacterized protein n=1 Tax=Cardiocondyla obscurior TaxID=286306 RepID=A0AAW2EV98_9HYME
MKISLNFNKHCTFLSPPKFRQLVDRVATFLTLQFPVDCPCACRSMYGGVHSLKSRVFSADVRRNASARTVPDRNIAPSKCQSTENFFKILLKITTFQCFFIFIFGSFLILCTRIFACCSASSVAATGKAMFNLAAVEINSPVPVEYPVSFGLNICNRFFFFNIWNIHFFKIFFCLFLLNAF